VPAQSMSWQCGATLPAFLLRLGQAGALRHARACTGDGRLFCSYVFSRHTRAEMKYWCRYFQPRATPTSA
jgi:hypothetical protein